MTCPKQFIKINHRNLILSFLVIREIATITYRSGPEWKKRFGRKLVDPAEPPSLCPSFEIEEYIMHQGETFSTKYDPNSLLYISKAMDMFEWGWVQLFRMMMMFNALSWCWMRRTSSYLSDGNLDEGCFVLTILLIIRLWTCLTWAMDMFDMGEGFSSLQEGVLRVQCPVMVLGVQTDILIPI
nr:uncharacterized protein LOC129278238 [Lytechinus pictus]